MSSCALSWNTGIAYRMHVDWMAAMAAVIARHCLRCRGNDGEHWLPAAFQLLIDLLT